jgi:hypothetical protein
MINSDRLPAEELAGSNGPDLGSDKTEVLLLGSAATRFVDVDLGYRQRLAEEGFAVVDSITSVNALEQVSTNLGRDQLGAVLVLDKVHEYQVEERGEDPKDLGNNMTAYVPQILGRLGLNSSAIYVPHYPMTSDHQRVLMQRGYAGIAEYSAQPAELIKNAARQVTSLLVAPESD